MTNVMNVTEIAATPSTLTLDSAQAAKKGSLSVVGLKGALYSPIQLENGDCTVNSNCFHNSCILISCQNRSFFNAKLG